MLQTQHINSSSLGRTVGAPPLRVVRSHPVIRKPICSERWELKAASESPSPLEPQKPSLLKGPLSGLLKSLQDTGLGVRSIGEGGAGLFVLMGASAAIGLLAWARGSALKTGHPYSATIQFPLACGISVGTSVRIRGVQIGGVMNVRPALDRVDVLVEVGDISTVIPRNCLIEANQSGLIAEPLIDITPQLPIPNIIHSPIDPRCEDEGTIVCDQGFIKGQQGVALDDLVYIMTRIARDMDAQGFDKFYAAAEAATAAINESRPLLADSAALLAEITPLLADLRSGGLADNVQDLVRSSAEAVAEIKTLQGAVLTDENVRSLRQAVQTLCTTLTHVERLTGDVGAMASDAGVQRNLKTLIGALGRIVED